MSTNLIKRVRNLYLNPLNFGSVIVSGQKVPALGRSRKMREKRRKSRAEKPIAGGTVMP